MCSDTSYEGLDGAEEIRIELMSEDLNSNEDQEEVVVDFDDIDS